MNRKKANYHYFDFVNDLDEIMTFKRIERSDYCLYYYLLQVANKRYDKATGRLQLKFYLTNEHIIAKFQAFCDTSLRESRRRLKALCLIDYKPGYGKHMATEYELIEGAFSKFKVSINNTNTNTIPDSIPNTIPDSIPHSQDNSTKNDTNTRRKNKQKENSTSRYRYKDKKGQLATPTAKFIEFEPPKNHKEFHLVDRIAKKFGEIGIGERFYIGFESNADGFVKISDNSSLIPETKQETNVFNNSMTVYIDKNEDNNE